MEDQQKLQEMVNQMTMYRQQAELIQQQIELIQASISEVNNLSNTLDELKDKDSVETFVPVGAGSFMKGELKNTDEVLMSIGGGVAVKKDVKGAKEVISTQKKDLEDSLDKMLKNLQQVSDVIGMLSPQIEQLNAKLMTK